MAAANSPRMRRRIALAVSIVLLLALVAPARAQEATARTGYVRLAIADWTTRIKGKTWWYTAIAAQETDLTAGVVDLTFMGVARGTCKTTRTKNFVTRVCTARGPAAEIPADQFEFDFLQMQSAHADMRLGKYHHTVDWTSEGDSAEPYAGSEGTFAGAGYGGGSSARASGTLFGVRLKPQPFGVFSFTLLLQDNGVGAGVSPEFPGLDVRRFADGSVEIRRVVYRVPVRRGAA